MKISVSSYSFQKDIKAGKLTQLDTVSKACELGFDAIEFIDLKPCDNPTLKEQLDYAYKIRQKADELKMDINAYTIAANLFKEGIEAEEEIKRIKTQLDVAKILGAKVLRHDVVWSLTKTGKGRSFDMMLPILSKNAREITEYGEKLGINTCSENHGYIAQDSDRMERLFCAVSHDNYGLLVDIGNFACVDEDSIKAVSRLAPYAIHVHCKDFKCYSFSDFDKKPEGMLISRGGNYLKGSILGEGDIPVKQCLKILKKAGYDDYVSIEFEGAEDCTLGISKGLANLRGYLSEIEAE